MLILCGECGKEFSDKAAACPSCGCPTDEMMNVQSPTADNSANDLSADYADGFYKGYLSEITIEGENIFYKTIGIKRNFAFNDIISIEFNEPTAIANGTLQIFTNKSSEIPYQIAFLKKDRQKFAELYDKLNTKLGLPTLQDKARKEVERIRQMDAEGIVYCPKCKSTSLSSNKKGFGIGKAMIGVAATGGIGLMAGNIGAKKVRITCLKCGHEFWAGK